MPTPPTYPGHWIPCPHCKGGRHRPELPLPDSRWVFCKHCQDDGRVKAGPSPWDQLFEDLRKSTPRKKPSERELDRVESYRKWRAAQKW